MKGYRWMDGRLDGWVDDWMDGQMGGWMNRWWMDGCLDVQMYGWIFLASPHMGWVQLCNGTNVQNTSCN